MIKIAPVEIDMSWRECHISLIFVCGSVTIISFFSYWIFLQEESNLFTNSFSSSVVMYGIHSQTGDKLLLCKLEVVSHECYKQ